MTKLLILSFFLFGFNSLIYSQTGDTIYFNKSWKVCAKEKAKFFRLVTQENGIYQIKDYYMTGIIQMQASAISLEPEVLDGPCVYYYADGTVKSSGNYQKGRYFGTWSSFHPNGRLKSKGVMNDGNPIGVWNFYDLKGEFEDKYNYDLELNVNRRAEDSIRKIRSKIPMSSFDKNFSMAVRGKLFGFFIIEDTYFSTATIGTELMFKGRHSLGIDYTYFGWQYEKDNTKDEALYETYERRGYVYVDYKCRLFSYKIFDLYFNMYDKYGTYRMWQEGVTEGYNAWEKPWLKDKTDGTFNQVGAGLGVKVYLSDRFYIDGSANGGKLFSDNNAVTHDSLGIANTQYHVKSEKNIFYIRINFGYKLFVKQKNKQDVFYTN